MINISFSLLLSFFSLSLFYFASVIMDIAAFRNNNLLAMVFDVYNAATIEDALISNGSFL